MASQHCQYSDNLLKNKICSKCLTLKDQFSFRVRQRKQIGYLNSSCKECDAAYSKGYRKNNPSKIKTYNKYYRDLHPDYGRNRPQSAKDRRLLQDKIRKDSDPEWNEKRKRTRKSEYSYKKARRYRLKISSRQPEIQDLKNFKLNAPKGQFIDHIIPLFNENVCGLNVMCNLQYLSKIESSLKGNSFDGTYENVGWMRKLRYWPTAKVGANGESALSIFRQPV